MPSGDFGPEANVRRTGTQDHLPMTHSSKPNRLMLIADPRPAPSSTEHVAVRRYRIARLRFEQRPQSGEGRFDHLERTYD
jgi:hypothetical protein